MGEEEVRVVQPDNPAPMWYENITLDEAERFITSNLQSAVRNVIAIGYYLKNIRDNGLFREAGCENIWDYAWERFGFSKSTASRYMTRNDRFSRNGNSPILDEKYRDFNKSQLQEMLSLTDSELEQVTPDMTVRQIREIHRPAKKPVPHVALPGQIELEDLIDANPAIFPVAEAQAPSEAYTVSVEDMLGEEVVATSQQIPEGVCENGSESEETAAEIAAEPLSAYGTPKRVYPPDSLISEEGCEGGHDCFGCAMDCRIRQEDRYCREAPLGNPFPCEIVKGGFADLPEGCQFVNHDLAYHYAGSGEPNPCCKDCQDPCEYICGRAMKALDQEAVISESDQESTQEYWNPDEEDPDERYNLGDFPQAKDKYLDKLAQLMVTYMGNRMITIGGPSHMQDEAIEEKLRIFANESGGEIWMSEGVTTYPCGEFIEFIRGEEDLGISSFSRFANHVRKIMETWVPQISEPADDTDLELVNKMLEKEKGNLDDMERVLQAEPDPTLEKLIRKKRLLVRALDGLLGEMDHSEKEKPEQPDLPNLKNNDQRKQFLETFHEWPVWFEVPEAAEVYYRYDLEDGCSLVICEYHYWVGWLKKYGDSPERTGTREYLLMPGYHYLDDCKSNRTAMVEKLKEIQKGGKERECKD